MDDVKELDARKKSINGNGLESDDSNDNETKKTKKSKKPTEANIADVIEKSRNYNRLIKAK